MEEMFVNNLLAERPTVRVVVVQVLELALDPAVVRRLALAPEREPIVLAVAAVHRHDRPVARVLQRDPPAAVQLAPAAAPAHQPDHLAAARIVSAIAAFRPADLVRATVRSAAVAEAPRDPPVRAADTAWVVADAVAVAAVVDVKNS